MSNEALVVTGVDASLYNILDSSQRGACKHLSETLNDCWMSKVSQSLRSTYVSGHECCIGLLSYPYGLITLDDAVTPWLRCHWYVVLKRALSTEKVL